MAIARLLAALLLLQSIPLGAALAQQQTQEADAAFAAQQFDRAATLYFKAAQAQPGVPRLWYQAGMSLHSQSKWAEAAAAMDKAMAAGLKNPSALYNAACAFARSGQPEKALDALAKAVAAGPAAANGLRADPDLEPLRKSPRFEALAAQVDAAVHPCRGDPQAHALDFWVGEWTVLSPNGTRAGESSVVAILDGCVVFESWTGQGGGDGKSFNLYDRATNQWRQTWVSSNGTQVDFRGGLNTEGAMVYQSEGKGPNGQPQRTRMTFSKLPGGKVRQLWEASSDGGVTWTVSFDGTYVPKALK